MSVVSILYYLLVFLGWLIPLAIGSSLTNKGNERIANWFNVIGALWFLFAIGYAIILYIRYLLTSPWMLPPTVFILFIIAITWVAYRFIFPSHKMAFQLKEISKYRGFTLPIIFFAPIAVTLSLYMLKINVDLETIRVLYSSIFVAFCSLLALVVMISIFIIERKVNHKIVNLLIQTIKGVSIMYGLTIMISLFALVFIPHNSINFNYNALNSLNVSIYSSMFLGALAITVNSIFLTIIIFFQIIDVLKEEVLPMESKTKIVFDETRLYSSGFRTYECSISNEKKDGFSYLRESLEDHNYSVSKLTVKPITLENLQKHDILVMARANEDYSTNELEAIEKFVQNGGGLILTAGFLDSVIKNKLSKRFGTSFSELGTVYHEINYSEDNKMFLEITNIKDGEIFDKIERFNSIQSSYITEEGNSELLAFTDNDSWFEKFDNTQKPKTSGKFPILSKMEYGNGNIVFIGSNYHFSNDWIHKLNNEQLGLNLIKWLESKHVTLNSDPNKSILPDINEIKHFNPNLEGDNSIDISLKNK